MLGRTDPKRKQDILPSAVSATQHWAAIRAISIMIANGAVAPGDRIGIPAPNLYNQCPACVMNHSDINVRSLQVP